MLIATVLLLLSQALLQTATTTTGCPIYLTISLAGKTFEDSSLVVNWGPECYNKPQWIGVFGEDPSTASLSSMEARIENINGSAGQALTEVKIGKLRFPKGWNRNDVGSSNYSNNNNNNSKNKSDNKSDNNGDGGGRTPNYAQGKCLPYYVASFSDNELLAVECLKIQPHWMSKLDHIAQMPLKDLFIPGTHASGAYLSATAKSKSPLLRDYGVAQHFDVWSQLIFGIRYLDLSLGYKQLVEKYNNLAADTFWIVNENVFVNPLRHILSDVKRFVMQSQEIVILDFSSFPIGFYKHPERHSNLARLLREEIGALAYQRNVTAPGAAAAQQCYQLTMEDVRAQQRYIVVLYPIEELPYPESESAMLCTNWKRFSTGAMNTSQTLDYMRLLYSKKENSPVHDEGWILHSIKSLEQALNTEKLQTSKERAASINPKVTNWLRGPWGLSANVVAMDYFSSTNIIDVAIAANLYKAFKNRYRNNFEISSA